MFDVLQCSRWSVLHAALRCANELETSRTLTLRRSSLGPRPALDRAAMRCSMECGYDAATASGSDAPVQSAPADVFAETIVNARVQSAPPTSVHASRTSSAGTPRGSAMPAGGVGAFGYNRRWSEPRCGRARVRMRVLRWFARHRHAGWRVVGSVLWCGAVRGLWSTVQEVVQKK